MKSSDSSPVFKRFSRIGAIAFLALASYTLWTFGHLAKTGWSTAYGDAEAHLNIARRLIDSRTPGGSQIGTVWLPLPHLLMAPFAAVDALWFNGLAGVIPSVFCYLLAAALLYLSAREAFRSEGSGLLAAAVFALNPNMLYLGLTPMTEPIMAAAIAGLLYATLRYREAPTWPELLIIAAVSNLASLTRYEGWFLIPFVALFIWKRGGLRHAVAFSALASLAPLAWLAHNQFYYGDPFAFYRGPYSAQAILARQLSQGMPQPATGNWWQAVRYYSYAVWHALGAPVLVLSALGMVVSVARRQFWPMAMLSLPPVFYVLSIHSGGTPVFVKELEPYTIYNSRYALAVLPLAGMAIASIQIRAVRVVAALVLVTQTFQVLPWGPVMEEAALVNRRDPNRMAGLALGSEYRPGAGIIFRFGELNGVFRAARIHFREGLYQDNLPQWNEALANPQVFQREEWALAEEGDEIDQAVQRQGSVYALRKRIEVKGKPAILIYRRSRQ